MALNPDGSLRARFAVAAGKPVDPDTMLRRPPIAQRQEADLSGNDMARYMNGLRLRLEDHIERNSLLWLAQETRRVFRRWEAPAARHPTPRWAAAHNPAGDALDYAAKLVRERAASRLQRFRGIAMVRLSQSNQPLRRSFLETASSFQKKFRQKQ